MKRYLILIVLMISFFAFLRLIFAQIIYHEETIRLPSITAFKEEMLINFENIRRIDVKHNRSGTKFRIFAEGPLNDKTLKRIALKCQTFISSQIFLEEYLPFAFEHSTVDAANEKHMPRITLTIDRDGDNNYDWSSETRYYKIKSSEIDNYQTWISETDF